MTEPSFIQLNTNKSIHNITHTHNIIKIKQAIVPTSNFNIPVRPIKGETAINPNELNHFLTLYASSKCVS